jgi:hypothetical protein
MAYRMADQSQFFILLPFFVIGHRVPLHRPDAAACSSLPETFYKKAFPKLQVLGNKQSLSSFPGSDRTKAAATADLKEKTVF